MLKPHSVYILLFLMLTIAPLQAYIDPATGSMLFSAMAGILVSSYFFFQQVIMKLKFFAPGARVKEDFRSIVIYSEGKQYWNVFRPLIEEFDRLGEECSYYSADPDDPGLKTDSPHIHTRFLGHGNRAFMKLNMLKADICVTTTPGLDVLQFKRSKGVRHYCHICHATDNTALYRLYSLDFYDSVMLNGTHQAGIIRELERLRNTKVKDLPVIGCTYLDILARKKASLPSRTNKEFTILISPSWGPNGLLSKYGLSMIKPLAEEGINIILRPHPQSSISEISLLDDLKKDLAGYQNIEWDFEKDNVFAMNRSDVMISDFSSVMYDFIFLFSRPVLTFNFELDPRGFELSDITDENPHYMVKDSGAIINLDAPDMKDIPQMIQSLKYDESLDQNIAKLSEIAWKHKGKSGEEAVRYILSVQKELA
jgi:CDP-Glycerol:Poly(glycerophosphate) glycerophosphotransferase